MHEDQGKETRFAWYRQQLAEKESIINGISDSIMLLNAKTYEILDINKAFLDLYMFNREQALGKTCYQITHHRRRPCSQLFGHAFRCRPHHCRPDARYCPGSSEFLPWRQIRRSGL